MPYNANIPQSGDKISTSQPQILGNFQEINTFVSVNHVDFNTADQGKHKFLQMPEQSSAPTTAANEGGLYTKESSLTTDTQLFWRRESSGTEIEFTNSSAAIVGWTRLPSGILLKWGNGTLNGTTTITFPVAASIPVFSNIFNVQITPRQTGGSNDVFANIISTAVASFDAFGSDLSLVAKNVDIFYYAIGD